MGLESSTTIEELNVNWPLGTDPKAQGDDHIRNLKVAVTGSNDERKAEIDAIELDVQNNKQDKAPTAISLGIATPGFIANGQTWVPFVDAGWFGSTDQTFALGETSRYMIFTGTATVDVDQAHPDGTQFWVGNFSVALNVTVQMNPVGTDKFYDIHLGANLDSLVIPPGTVAHFIQINQYWYVNRPES